MTMEEAAPVIQRCRRHLPQRPAYAPVSGQESEEDAQRTPLAWPL